MQEPTLREVFRASWKLTWNHKALWILGLFALLLGQLGIFDVVSGIFKGASEESLLGITEQIRYVFSPSTLHEVGTVLNYSFESWGALALLLVILFGLGATLLVIAAISQGGIVHAAALSMKHGLKSMEKFEESWHAGARHVSSIVVLNIVKKSILFALSLGVAAAALAASIYGTTLSIVIFLVIFIVSVFVGMVASMLTFYMVGYLVVEEKDLFGALRHAWNLLWKHWVVSFEVGLVLIVCNALVVAALLVGMYVFIAPSLALNAYGTLIGNLELAQMGTSIAIVLMLAYAAIVGSIFTVFVTTAWTYLFAIMHRWGFRSRVHAFFGGLKRS